MLVYCPCQASLLSSGPIDVIAASSTSHSITVERRPSSLINTESHALSRLLQEDIDRSHRLLISIERFLFSQYWGLLLSYKSIISFCLKSIAMRILTAFPYRFTCTQWVNKKVRRSRSPHPHSPRQRDPWQACPWLCRRQSRIA